MPPRRSRESADSEDLVAIVQLLSAYCHALDSGAVDDLVAFFHPDGSLSAGHAAAAPYVGSEQIRAYYASHAETVSATLRHVRHKVATPAIRIEGATASSSCYFDADGIDSTSGLPLVVAGKYEDSLVREGGQWLLMKRRVVVLYSCVLEVRGELTEYPVSA
jgi:hypothetical protein